MMLQFFSMLGLALSLVLIIRARTNYKGNYYLGVFFLLSSLWGMITHELYYTNHLGYLNLMLISITPLVFLSAPFLYFYIRSVINDDYHLYKKDLWHLIPAGIALLLIMPFMFANVDLKVHYLDLLRSNHSLFTADLNYLMPHSLGLILRPLYYLFYIRLCTRLISSHEIKIRDKKIHKESYYKYFSVWINLTMSALSLTVGMFIFLDLMDLFVVNANRLMYIQMVEVVIVVIFAILNMSFLFIPTMMFGLPQPGKEVIAANMLSQLENDELTLTVPQPASSEPGAISQEYIRSMNEQIKDYLLDKPYIQPSFNKVNLSAGTNIPMHHLSFYFNQVVEKSFAEWRNELRIEHAIEMIKEGKAKVLTLDSIASESGFSNQTTFISSFKKYTGTTPNNFIKDYKWD